VTDFAEPFAASAPLGRTARRADEPVIVREKLLPPLDPAFAAELRRIAYRIDRVAALL
jgi:hypothetical protein